MDQQNELLRQINDLKVDSHKQNVDRYEALHEINTLKEELSKNRTDEELRKKYVYDVIVDNNSKVNHIYEGIKMGPMYESENNNNDFKPSKQNNNNNNNNNYKKQTYEEESTNSKQNFDYVGKVPELYNERNGLKVESKFIDIDTYNVNNVSFIYIN